MSAHGFPMGGEEPLAEPIAEVETIIKYDDPEAGHGHEQMGVAGERVNGKYYHKVS